MQKNRHFQTGEQAKADGKYIGHNTPYTKKVRAATTIGYYPEVWRLR